LRRRRSKISSTLAIVLGAATALAGASSESTPRPERVGCIDAWGEARYRNYGYDHIVHLRSRCRVRVLCDVSTNVNPNPVRTSVPAGESVEVLTFRGSSAQEFTLKVSCELPGRAAKSAAVSALRLP
jgi:hypothetical protein